MRQHIYRHVQIYVLSLLAILASAGDVTAQSMSYSVYMDEYGDEYYNMIGYAELEDWSGCASGTPIPYQMHMYSPTNRYTSVFNSNTIMLSSEWEEGQWQISSLFQFNCNCNPQGGSHTFTVGSTAWPGISLRVTFYDNPTYDKDKNRCNYTGIICASGSPTCFFGGGLNAFQGGTCPPYMKRTWFVATREKEGQTTHNCLFGLDAAADKPGVCS
jgi:hypothetical protein